MEIVDWESIRFNDRLFAYLAKTFCLLTDEMQGQLKKASFACGFRDFCDHDKTNTDMLSLNDVNQTHLMLHAGGNWSRKLA